MQRRLTFAWLLLLLVVLAVAKLTQAQQTTATLSGVVKDSSGAVVPSAKVTVLRVETGETRLLTADASGYYYVSLLPIGEYRLRVEATGFQTQDITGIRLELGQAGIVNVALTLGQVSEHVTVNGEAPLVDTTSPSLSGIVSDQQLAELPMNGRDYMQLAKNQQGVIWYRSENGSSQTAGIGQRISVGGARDDENLFLMDGTIINDVSNSTPGGADGSTLGVETIAEFQILTSTYSAEFGRNAGGVVNVVTKSGANVLHGSAYEFIRNDVLDAKNYFDLASNPIPPYKRNQFGALVTGPIRKDKTFFMFNYEGLRERKGLSSVVRVPTAAARLGQFSSGNVTVSPLVVPYLSLYPLPNSTLFGDGTGDYASSPNQPTNENFYVGRIDHNFSANDHLFVRYTYDFSLQQAPDGDFLFDNDFLVHNQYITAEEQHIFSPTLLNTFRFGFSRSHSDQYPSAITPIPASLSFIAGQPIGQIAVTGGLSALGTPTIGPRNYAYNIFDLQDHVSLTKGRHSLKFGVNFNRSQDNENSNFESAGTYTFPSLKSFLQDKAQTLEIQLPGTDAIRGLRQFLGGMYVQDEFRMTPRLMFDLGLRYEFITVPTEVNNKLANLRNVTDPATTIGPFFRNPSLKNFAPRLGLAWDPFGDGRTSVRLGAGLYYDEVTSTYTTLPATRQPPFFVQADVSNPPFPNPASAINGVAPLLRLDNINYNLQTPRRTQYNLSIQHDLPGAITFNIGYVGSQSRHLIVYTDEANTALPTILPDGQYFHAAGLPRRNPNFANINRRASDGVASYNALQTGINRRFNKDFLLQVSYTWSKNLTDGDITEASTNDDNAFIVTNPDHYQRGLSEFNVEHNVVINHVFLLPFGTGQKWGSGAPGAVRAVISGWEWDGIATLASGQPFSVVLGFDQARQHVRSGGGGERPDEIAGCNAIFGGPVKYYNPACFAVPAPGFYGNMAPNQLIGPGFEAYDTSVVRKFRLKERFVVDFRGEFFNILNHPNWDVPGTTVFTAGAAGTTTNPGLGAIVNPAAGQITRTVSTSRQIQFGLKLGF